MKRLKENILNQLSTSSSTDNSTPSTSSSTDNSTPSTSYSTDNFTTKSSDAYIGIVDILAIGVGTVALFAFLGKNCLRSQIKNKPRMSNPLNHQNNVICFRYDGEKILYINE